jgi:hypothetical protein
VNVSMNVTVHRNRIIMWQHCLLTVQYSSTCTARMHVTSHAALEKLGRNRVTNYVGILYCRLHVEFWRMDITN